MSYTLDPAAEWQDLCLRGARVLRSLSLSSLFVDASLAASPQLPSCFSPFLSLRSSVCVCARLYVFFGAAAFLFLLQCCLDEGFNGWVGMLLIAPTMGFISLCYAGPWGCE